MGCLLTSDAVQSLSVKRPHQCQHACRLSRHCWVAKTSSGRNLRSNRESIILSLTVLMLARGARAASGGTFERDLRHDRLQFLTPLEL